MYGEEATQVEAVATIVSRAEQIEKLVDKAQEVLTELEARISPILQQEPPEQLESVPHRSTSDTSSTVAQRLSSIEIRMTGLITRIHMITLRSEV